MALQYLGLNAMVGESSNPEVGQIIWLGRHFEKVAFRGGCNFLRKLKQVSVKLVLGLIFAVLSWRKIQI